MGHAQGSVFEIISIASVTFKMNKNVTNFVSEYAIKF